jgi:DNA-binding transcriptional LysR family regulator
MLDLNDLYYFALVVDHGGFAPAGRALGIPKSKLSRRIALLEERLGAKLILRSTRSFAVTELGRGYYAHCRAMLTEAEAAEESVAVTHAEPRGVIRMSCPVALLALRIWRASRAWTWASHRMSTDGCSKARTVPAPRSGTSLATSRGPCWP